jgi:hypothetical protein
MGGAELRVQRQPVSALIWAVPAFPWLSCASTPRYATSARHPNAVNLAANCQNTPGNDVREQTPSHHQPEGTPAALSGGVV